jgi:hypothetical protein
MDEQKIKKIALEVFQSQLKQSQYQVTPVPVHIHNGTDTPRIPPSSVINFVSLPSTVSTNGVLSPDNIGVAQPPFATIYPLPIINGYGVGAFSQFNGGDAPYGSMVGFQNGSTVQQLWVMMTDNAGDPQWKGIDLTLTA